MEYFRIYSGKSNHPGSFNVLNKKPTIMNIFNSKVLLGLTLIIFSFCSCQKDIDEVQNDSMFSIEFSDGTTIKESDLHYYDLSTHMVYLKKGLNLQNGISSFNVIVDNETIYQGIIHPSVLSSPPKQPIFISDVSFYGNDILQISCFVDSADRRSDERIKNALAESNLLHHGIQCTIDKIQVTSFNNYSKVNCTITLTNNDSFNYYILDPKKMGELKFNYYTNGLHFINIDTQISSFLRWSIPCDWSNLTLNDLSLLKSGEKISYTFESSDYYRMDQGFYKAYFNFCGAEHNTKNFELNQKGGRIWIGRIYSTFNNITVN